MSPQGILKAALAKGIDILGICDHNTTENSLAVIKAAENMDITILPGMEVTSQEEVHVLGLFDAFADAQKLQEYVYANLPGKNDEKTFGMQVIVNEKEEVLGFNERLLIGATTIPLEKVIHAIHARGGIAIASHIDREAFSILGQLGFIPDDLELDALEVSPRVTVAAAREKYPYDIPITCSSDAHYPDDIGKGFTSFLLDSDPVTGVSMVSEIKKALRNEDGRKIID
jgi:predicted metal-dependent phosphoesterase TrpH